MLLIDCDPQANLTSWLRATPGSGGSTLYDVLRGQATVRSAAVATRWANLSVVPASYRLHEIDRGALAGERVLWARMCDDYDYAIFDCSASPGVVLTNALTAANDVIVPVQAKGMPLGGIERLQEMVGEIAQRSSNPLEISGVLMCLFDGRTRISRLVLGELRARYSELVFDTVVHENVKLSEAADRRMPITEYAPDSRGAAEYGAVAFELSERCSATAAAPPAVGPGKHRYLPGEQRSCCHYVATPRCHLGRGGSSPTLIAPGADAHWYHPSMTCIATIRR